MPRRAPGCRRGPGGPGGHGGVPAWAAAAAGGEQQAASSDAANGVATAPAAAYGAAARLPPRGSPRWWHCALSRCATHLRGRVVETAECGDVAGGRNRRSRGDGLHLTCLGHPAGHPLECMRRERHLGPPLGAAARAAPRWALRQQLRLNRPAGVPIEVGQGRGEDWRKRRRRALMCARRARGGARRGGAMHRLPALLPPTPSAAPKSAATRQQLIYSLYMPKPDLQPISWANASVLRAQRTLITAISSQCTPATAAGGGQRVRGRAGIGRERALRCCCAQPQVHTGNTWRCQGKLIVRCNPYRWGSAGGKGTPGNLAWGMGMPVGAQRNQG